MGLGDIAYPRLPSRDAFPKASEVYCGSLETLAHQLDIGESDCVVVMTHQYIRDLAVLRRMEQIRPGYIAVLGPAERIEPLLSMLRFPTAVHAPGGLAIGAEGPEEIAVSIVAELI